MNHEIEVKRLPMEDGSELILTNTRVIQEKMRAFAGSQKTIPPLEAITSVRIGWARNVEILGMGVAVFLTPVLVYLIAGVLPGQREFQEFLKRGPGILYVLAISSVSCWDLLAYPGAVRFELPRRR